MKVVTDFHIVKALTSLENVGTVVIVMKIVAVLRVETHLSNVNVSKLFEKS